MEFPKHIREVYAKATCVFSKEEVESALDRMANDMNVRLSGTNPVLLCVVIGGIVPLGNLLPRLDFHLAIDYIHATRYTGETKGGEIQLKAKPVSDLRGRTVVIVDDVLDGGLTLAAIAEHCKERGAKKVYSAVLLEKKDTREPGGLETADFKGLTMDDRFIFGYGLDYAEYLRNAPGIYAVAEEHK